MNRSIRHTFLAATTACGLWLAPATAQTTATTDPVGAMTVTIPAHDGGDDTIAAVSLPFNGNPLFEGKVQSVSGNNLSFSDESFTPDEFASKDMNGDALHSVYFKSGGAEGIDIDIESNSANTLLLSEDVEGLVDVDDEVIIRKYLTIGQLFGADNTFNLQGGTSAASSDIVYLLNRQGAFVPYFYQEAPPFAGGTGWRKSGAAGVDASEVRIEWDTIFISRSGASARLEVEIVSAGTVATGLVKKPVHPGLNLLGYSFPLETTLGELGLPVDQLVKGTSAGSSDIVYVLESVSGGSAWVPYYYQEAPPFAGGTGWRKSGAAGVDASGTSIPADTAVLIERIGGSSFYLINNQPF